MARRAGAEEASTLPPLAAPRRVFRDPEHEAQFREDGYVVVDLVDPTAVGCLRAVVEALLPDVSGFHSSLMSADVGYRQAVFEQVPPVVASAVDSLLAAYAPFAASLTVKCPGAEGHLDSHQDWSMVDEEQFRGINVWIPLEPTSVDNGTLRVLPRSHRALDHLRCSPCNPASFESEQNLVPIDRLVPLDVDLGQAVVFDQGLLHGSGSNTTEAMRPAVTIAYRPDDAPLLHYFVADPDLDEVEVYRVDPEFFTELVVGSTPDRPRLATRPFVGTRWTWEALVEACADPAPAAGRVDAPAPTFVDADLQARFAEDGYVVVDVLGPEEVAAYDRLVDALFTGDAVGFHATNMLPSPEYRQAVWRGLRPMLEPKLLPLFVDHEACTAALMIKFPDEGSGFIAHQDWSLVDEDRFRSVNVWIPLVDAHRDNGGLRVLAGSHRMLHAVRCSPAPPASYQPPGWQVSLTDLRLLDVRAGQAVIFDHAILHGSEPNRSGDPRRAVTLAFKPVAAQLYHWYLPAPDAEVLEQYAIAPDYLADFVLGVPPPYPLVGEVAFTPDAVSPAELVGRPVQPVVPVDATDHLRAEVTVLHDAPVAVDRPDDVDRVAPPPVADHAAGVVDPPARWSFLPPTLLDATRGVRRVARRVRPARDGS